MEPAADSFTLKTSIRVAWLLCWMTACPTKLAHPANGTEESILKCGMGCPVTAPFQIIGCIILAMYRTIILLSLHQQIICNMKQYKKNALEFICTKPTNHQNSFVRNELCQNSVVQTEPSASEFSCAE